MIGWSASGDWQQGALSCVRLLDMNISRGQWFCTGCYETDTQNPEVFFFMPNKYFCLMILLGDGDQCTTKWAKNDDVLNFLSLPKQNNNTATVIVDLVQFIWRY